MKVIKTEVRRIRIAAAKIDRKSFPPEENYP